MKLPFPRRFKAWLVALVSLTAVALVSIAPLMRPRAQSSTTYTFTDLGNLGGTYSRALGINNCGQIVGESSLTGVSPTHPFIWRNGVMSDLGTLGGVRGLATDINASGLVVGFSTIATGEQRAFRWFDLDGDGVPDPGEMNDLGVLPNHSTHGAFSVNDNGQIVGSAESDFGEASAFIWNASTGLQLLATLNAIAPSHGYAINNSSHIAGYASSIDKAFVFNGTTNIDLNTFGGPRSIAYDINAAGHAVGFADVDASSASPPSHAFKWNGTLPLQDLGVLTGGVRSQAYSINSSGTVVGYSEVTGGAPHAFVHDGTQMYDLNASVTNLPVGWTLTHARGINDGGQIVGQVTTSGGETHAFLLTPTTFTPTCSPTVTVTVSPEFVSEDGATNLTYTFTRAPVTSTALTVNFSTSGSATRAVDYAVSGTGITYDPGTGSGTVAFAAGEITKNVIIDPATDSAAETNETVVLTTTAGAGYIVGTPTSATGTINNDDTNVSVSVAPPSVIEDGAGTGNLVYTFTRSGLTSAITVNFTLTGSTATFGTDYTQSCASCSSFTALGGAINFGIGETSKTVTVTPTLDTTDEPNEFVTLNVATGTGYTVGSPSTAIGTITDNDGPPTISINTVTAAEGNSGTTAFVFNVSLSNASSSVVTVNYQAASGTTNPATGGTLCTTAGTDFINTSGTLTFAANETLKPVTVSVCGDTNVEANETFFVNLSGNSANSVLPTGTKGTGTINNDDSIPSVGVAVSPPAAAEDGATNLVYTFTRTGVATGALTVNFSLAGSTATLNTDYSQTGASFTPPTGSVTFANGDLTKTVTVNPTTDATVESDETVILTLTADAAYTIGSPSSATGTITNDETVQLGQSTFTVTEDSPVATITVTRSGVASSAATVKYSTSDMAGLQSCTTVNLMASERCDYTTTVGTVTFAPTETSKTFTVPIVDDVWVEGNETFFVNLSNPVGASLGSQATSTVEIDDNDLAPLTSNPIFGVEYFIRALYRDILNRQPDSQGLQNWIDTLTPCPNGGFGEPPMSDCDRLHIAAGFFQSDEYLNRGYWAFRFYMVSFNQRPTYAQFIPDLSEVGGPKSPAEEETAKVAYAEAFVQRQTFIQEYGSLSGQALADALTQKTGLPPFTVNGETNGQILRKIAERQTSLDKFLTEGTVSILYFGFQRRDPDTVGYQNNVDTLNANPNNLRHMIFIFIYSTEYLNRFGPQ